MPFTTIAFKLLENKVRSVGSACAALPFGNTDLTGRVACTALNMRQNPAPN